MAAYSWGTFATGNLYYKLCKNNISSDLTYCDGFITGSFDNYLEDIQKFYGLKFTNCYSNKSFSSATTQQLNDVFIKWLSNNPGPRNKNASCLFVDAMADTYLAPSVCIKYSESHENPKKIAIGPLIHCSSD